MNLTQKTKNRILKLESEDIDERKEAIAQLSEKENNDLEKLLISFLKKNTSRLFREGACKILGEIGSEDSVDILIKCLNDKHDGVQFHAAVALGKIAYEKAVNPLIEKLAKGIDPLLKSEAIVALGKIGDKKAVKPLVKVLQNDEDVFVRHHVAKTLGLLGDNYAIKPLQKIAQDNKNTRLNYLAMNAIQEIRTRNH